MKARSASSVRELLGSAELSGWFRRYQDLRQAIEAARVRRGDLLGQAYMVRYRAELTQQDGDQRLFAGGECEDLAARSHAEAAEIENNSFESLSAYELQRQRAIDVLSECDGLEKLVEDERQVASDLRARLDAARKSQTPEGRSEAQRLEMRLEEIELRVGEYARREREAALRRQREEARKQELWLDVEAAWSASFRASMARGEFAFEGRRVRAESEALFQRAAAERQRVAELEADAERVRRRVAELEEAYDGLLEEGRRAFDCVLINEFLYWPDADDVKAVLCVPLVDDLDQLNIQIHALQLYRLERGRGLEYVEPVPEHDPRAGDGGDDPRLAAFFTRAARGGG